MKIEEYGLKAIPFKSQGSESGKYPFVPSDSFNELIAEIEKIHQQKDSSAIIVQGPQGSGKTATRNGLHDYFSQKSDVAIISVNLSSVDVRDLSWSVVNEAKKQNLVNDEFLQTIGYSEGTNIEKPKLEQIIISIIEEIISKNEFGILIIDEFDIISQPTFHDTNDQTIFLHNITNILNSINESKTIQEKSFCTILAQTDKSSEDFRDYISNRHKPLSTRLKKNIDINYNLDETKKIVQKRLEYERIPEFEIPSGNELFPLDEQIIKFLYEKINHLTQSDSMKAFRDMEQILHDSIEQSLDQELLKVEITLVEEIFSQNISKFETNLENDLRHISLETNIELTNTMKENEKDPSFANNFYLNGIKTGMKTWETGLYKNVESLGANSRLIPNEKNDVFISSIKIDFTSNTKHHKSVFWYVASKKLREVFTDIDLESIHSFLEEHKHEQNGCQFSILTLFEEHSTKNEQELQKTFNNVIDKIYIRNNLFKQSIIGIEISSSIEEKNQFRKDWDTYLHNVFTDKLGETLHDIDKEFNTKHKILVQILYTKSLVDETLKRIDLVSLAKQISHSQITNPVVNDVITFGFADEEFNTFIPRNLKSIKNLIDLNKTYLEITTHFSKSFALDAARELGIVDVIDNNYQLNSIDFLKNEISEELLDKISSALSEDSTKYSINETILKLLKDAFEKIDDEDNYFKKIIILNFIKEQSIKSLEDLSSNSLHDEKFEDDSETTQHEDDSETTQHEDDSETTQHEDDSETTQHEDDSETIVTEIDIDSVLKICREILTGNKLTISELKKEISEKRGFEDPSKWVTLIFELIHTEKLMLTIKPSS
jgi:hypothetical protein